MDEEIKKDMLADYFSRYTKSDWEKLQKELEKVLWNAFAFETGLRYSWEEVKSGQTIEPSYLISEKQREYIKKFPYVQNLYQTFSWMVYADTYLSLMKEKYGNDYSIFEKFL